MNASQTEIWVLSISLLTWTRPTDKVPLPLNEFIYLLSKLLTKNLTFSYKIWWWNQKTTSSRPDDELKPCRKGLQEFVSLCPQSERWGGTYIISTGIIDRSLQLQCAGQPYGHPELWKVCIHTQSKPKKFFISYTANSTSDKKQFHGFCHIHNTNVRFQNLTQIHKNTNNSFEVLKH